MNNSCYYCNSKSLEIINKVSGYEIAKCRACTLIQTRIKEGMNLKYINNRIYSNVYVHNYLLRKDEIKLKFYKKVIDIDNLRKGGRLLDIGCGIGLFLETVKKYSKYNWELYGIDININLVRIAKNIVKEAKIKNISFINSNFPTNYFDVVTCFDVLEHDKMLPSTLQKIVLSLKQGGILVIQSPNYNSIMRLLCEKNWDWWLVPDHIFHFEIKSILRVLRDNKLNIVKYKTIDSKKDFINNVVGSFKRKSFINYPLIAKKLTLLVIRVFLNIFYPLIYPLERINLGGLLVIIARKV